MPVTDTKRMDGSQQNQSPQSLSSSAEEPKDKPPTTSPSSASPSQAPQVPTTSHSPPPESPHEKDSRNGTSPACTKPSGPPKPTYANNRDRRQSDSHNGGHSKPNSSEYPPQRPPPSPRRDYRPVREQLAELRDEIKRLQDKERRKAHELSMEEEQHKETKRLLQSKIDELDGMQAFTKKADQASETDVVDLVKELNAAISQAASFISDPQHLSSVTYIALQPDIRQATETIGAKLGKEMADTVRTLRDLRRKSRREDPTAVQFALQITMTRLCDKIVNAWTSHPDADKYLSGTYEKIRASQSQTIAGRWRALTRAQAGGAKDPTAIVNHLIDRLRFEKHLLSVADIVIRVQTTAGESITSVDVMPYFYPPGTEFTEDNMEDMYPSRKTKGTRRGPILGTTELGLWKKEKLKTDANGKSGDQNIALLKAKVVFTSSLQE